MTPSSYLRGSERNIRSHVDIFFLQATYAVANDLVYGSMQMLFPSSHLRGSELELGSAFVECPFKPPMR